METAVILIDLGQVDKENKLMFEGEVQKMGFYPEQQKVARLLGFVEGLEVGEVVGEIIKERVGFRKERLLWSIPSLGNLIISLNNSRVIEDFPPNLAKCSRRPIVVESCKSRGSATKLIVVPCEHPN